MKVTGRLQDSVMWVFAYLMVGAMLLLGSTFVVLPLTRSERHWPTIAVGAATVLVSILLFVFIQMFHRNWRIELTESELSEWNWRGQKKIAIPVSDITSIVREYDRDDEKASVIVCKSPSGTLRYTSGVSDFGELNLQLERLTNIQIETVRP